MRFSDEATLIEQARRDPDAFAALYQHYLRLGSRHDSEDIASQVFIEVLEALQGNRYKETGCFPAWLFTIVRRRLVDFQRQRPPIPLEEVAASEPGPLDLLLRDENLERLSALLAELDDGKQEILRLRFAAELSFAEIAALENQSEAAVKMSIYRLIDWLRKHWEVDRG